MLPAQIQQLTFIQTQPVFLGSTPPTIPPPPACKPRVGTPERYAGDLETCNAFLTSCSILFALPPHTFASEQAKVAFNINNLTGTARLWVTTKWERAMAAPQLHKVFSLASLGAIAAQSLLNLHQGEQMVVDYSIDFHTKAYRVTATYIWLSTLNLYCGQASHFIFRCPAKGRTSVASGTRWLPLCLSPHRPYGCAIDLQPGTSPPKERPSRPSRPSRPTAVGSKTNLYTIHNIYTLDSMNTIYNMYIPQHIDTIHSVYTLHNTDTLHIIYPLRSIY